MRDILCGSVCGAWRHAPRLKKLGVLLVGVKNAAEVLAAYAAQVTFAGVYNPAYFFLGGNAIPGNYFAQAGCTMAGQFEYEGLLPDPEHLAKYEKVQPGFADRMLKMAEQEMQHRREQDSKIVKSTLRSSLLGIIAAFLSVLCICSLAAYGFYMGYDKASAGLVVGSAAAIVSAFLISRRKQNGANGTQK